MKYDEAIKLIKGLSKEYSINNDKSVFKLIYKGKPIAWVDKLEQFNFGRCNTLAPEFNKLPHNRRLWMILAELAMTPLNEREEHKWNVIVGNDSSGFDDIICWRKEGRNSFLLCLADSNSLKNKSKIFTDSEFSDLIEHIKTLPDGEWQAKIAEHGKTEVKSEDGEDYTGAGRQPD